MTSIQSHTTSNINSISQYAAIEAIKNSEKDLKIMVKEFDNRRKYMIKRLDGIEGIQYIVPKGAFYVMVNINNFFGKKINNTVIKDSLSFSKELLEEEKVAVVPGIGFGVDDFIRLSYATSKENIEEGMDRIEKFIKKLS